MSFIGAQRILSKAWKGSFIGASIQGRITAVVTRHDFARLAIEYAVSCLMHVILR